MAWPCDAVCRLRSCDGERHRAINVGADPFYGTRSSHYSRRISSILRVICTARKSPSFVDFLRASAVQRTEQLSELLKVDIDDARAVLRRMSS